MEEMYSPCPLAKREDSKHRDDPDNREMTFAHQFHDTCVNLFQFSILKDPATRDRLFNDGIKILKSQILSYERYDESCN